ncbi:MAG: hypothetical protein JST23_10195, partial [Bacteroidetes bacterium]|nr:hypothetical protein [Bacteroidota bacterium]
GHNISTYCLYDVQQGGDDGSGGGYEGEGSGAGGNGGSGSGGGGTPPNCTPGHHRSAQYPPCEPGWEPLEDEGGNPLPPEPIDSLLAKYSRAIRDTAIYIYDNLSKPYNIEYSFTGTLQNGQIIPIEIRTNNDSLFVIPKVMIGRVPLLFIWHSHVSLNSDTRERGCFSPDDINVLRNVRCLSQGFISFVDCRDKRYALVISNVTKATTFFNNTNYEQLYTNYTSAYSINTQEYQINCIKNAIGNSTVNGVSLYVSNDSPNFQTWTLLNP